MPSDAAVVHVVDDDEAMRQSMAFLLRTANIQVQTYEAAADFLNALSQAKAGCVVTDVRMPGMSGIELLQRLRNLKVSMPVIVITGHGDVPLAVEAMKGGAMDFIEKPFDDEVLLGAVRAALSANAIDSERQMLNRGSLAVWRPSPIESVRCSRGWLRVIPTKLSLMILE
jgi:two-component system, LuxR family, response regulator FixJ